MRSRASDVTDLDQTRIAVQNQSWRMLRSELDQHDDIQNLVNMTREIAGERDRERRIERERERESECDLSETV